MTDLNHFRQLALSLPETSERPHFEKLSFRVAKKIFATLDLKKNLACLKLSLSDQDIFSLANKTIIYSVPNKWGKQGWTFVDLSCVNSQLLEGALKAAYCYVAPKKLADAIQTDKD